MRELYRQLSEMEHIKVREFDASIPSFEVGVRHPMSFRKMEATAKLQELRVERLPGGGLQISPRDPEHRGTLGIILTAPPTGSKILRTLTFHVVGVHEQPKEVREEFVRFIRALENKP